MINVLVAEDSAVTRELIANVLSAEPGIRVVATTDNGRDAVELTRRMRPDVVTMDVLMPCLDGFGATSAIMRIAPTPTVLMSNFFDSEHPIFLRNAARARAWAVAPKPPSIDAPEFDAAAGTLVDLVRQAARSGADWDGSEATHASCIESKRSLVIVAPGAAPATLREMLDEVPSELPISVLAVVDDPASIADALHGRTRLPVVVPTGPVSLHPGLTYLLRADREPAFTASAEPAFVRPLAGARACALARVLERIADDIGTSAIVVFRDLAREDLSLGLIALRLSGAVIFAETDDELNGPENESARVASGWAHGFLSLGGLGEALVSIAGRRPS